MRWSREEGGLSSCFKHSIYRKRIALIAKLRWRHPTIEDNLLTGTLGSSRRDY